MVPQIDRTFSLLRPDDGSIETARIPEERGILLPQETIKDLSLENIVKSLKHGNSTEKHIREIVYRLPTDDQTILYRQDIIEDLSGNAALSSGFEELLPLFRDLLSFRPSGYEDQYLFEVTRRLGELELYLQIVEGLKTLLDSCKDQIKSEGLHRLQEKVTALLADPLIKDLKEELPDLLSQVRGIKSVTIGVNLDHRMRPHQATLLSIENRRFDGQSTTFMKRLFKNSAQNSREGIAQLHSVPKTGEAGIEGGSTGEAVHPMMVPLFRDLAEVLNKVSRPIAHALRKYVSINVEFLSTVSRELSFYLGAVRMFRDIQSMGLPVCRPTIADNEKRIFLSKNLYNLHLIVMNRSQSDDAQSCEGIVPNDVFFTEEQRIFILTGPNRGGKTTYMQAVGIAQVLSQIGLPIPAEQAALSPVGTIYTHFPTEEKPELASGRFGEEAERLNRIFTRAAPTDLLLLNESLSTTSHSESLYLCRDLVRILLLLGVKTIFATHLHELAAEVESLNREYGNGKLAVSLVALINEEESADSQTCSFRRTFKIVPGPPAGKSYAREIATHYGITFRQLRDMLKQRGVL